MVLHIFVWIRCLFLTLNSIDVWFIDCSNFCRNKIISAILNNLTVRLNNLYHPLSIKHQSYPKSKKSEHSNKLPPYWILTRIWRRRCQITVMLDKRTHRVLQLLRLVGIVFLLAIVTWSNKLFWRTATTVDYQ